MGHAVTAEHSPHFLDAVVNIKVRAATATALTQVSLTPFATSALPQSRLL